MTKKPIVALSLITVLCYGLLFLYRQPHDPQILMIGGALLVINLATYAIIRLAHLGDEYLFLIQALLVTLGSTMLCRLDYGLGTRQIGWYLLGICVFYAAYFVYRYIPGLRRLKWCYVAMTVALFLVTLIFGRSISGAKNWIYIGSFSFQPSEVIKLLFVFYLASYFGGERDGVLFRLPERYTVSAVTYLFMGFLILQREWGSTLLFFFTYLMLLYIYEKDWLLFAANLLAMVLVALVGASLLRHIQVRIDTWMDPWSDIANTGYQITQSLFAIAAGGFFGTGIGMGMPEVIPEVHSDFIFSAICEEMGIFGGAAVILLYFILVYRGFKIAIPLKDGFDKAVALGITIMLGLQTFIIIGGVIKLIPLTGITLPFISYGGSSLVISLASLGILQAVSTREAEEL